MMMNDDHHHQGHHGRRRRDFDHRNGANNNSMPYAPQIGSIEKGKVVRMEDYGAFVKFDNYLGNGLVHLSQIQRYVRAV